MTMKQNERRRRSLARLESQLEKIPLTEKDVKRIKKEIAVLKSRI